jgi:hypothetical protein
MLFIIKAFHPKRRSTVSARQFSRNGRKKGVLLEAQFLTAL